MTNTKVNKYDRVNDLGMHWFDKEAFIKDVREDRDNTVSKNPDKRYMYDPFVGYVEIKR